MEEVPAPTPVVPTPSPTAPPVQPAVVVPAPVPTPPPPAQPVDVKSDKKPIFIIVGIVILLVVVSLLVGLFIKSRKTGVRTVDLSKGGKNPALTAFEDLNLALKNYYEIFYKYDKENALNLVKKIRMYYDIANRLQYDPKTSNQDVLLIGRLTMLAVAFMGLAELKISLEL